MSVTDGVGTSPVDGVRVGGWVRKSIPAEGAACAGMDTESFFVTDPEEVAVAQQVCATCPVQLRCLAGALARDERWGVWGGWSFQPRIVRAQVRPATNHDRQGGWCVRTVDVVGSRLSRWFRTEDEALAVAQAGLADSTGRLELGHRLSHVLVGLVPDDELHDDPSARPFEQSTLTESTDLEGSTVENQVPQDLVAEDLSVEDSGQADPLLAQLMQVLVTRFRAVAA